MKTSNTVLHVKPATLAGMDLKGQNILAEGQIRAERKAGGILQEVNKSAGGRPKTTSTEEGLTIQP